MRHGVHEQNDWTGPPPGPGGVSERGRQKTLDCVKNKYEYDKLGCWLRVSDGRVYTERSACMFVSKLKYTIKPVFLE